MTSSRAGSEPERVAAAVLLTAVGTGPELPLPAVLWARRGAQGTETLREGLWTLGGAHVHPSYGRGVEAADQNNNVTLSAHTEVAPDTFGLHLTTLGKGNQGGTARAKFAGEQEATSHIIYNRH